MATGGAVGAWWFVRQGMEATVAADPALLGAGLWPIFWASAGPLFAVLGLLGGAVTGMVLAVTAGVLLYAAGVGPADAGAGRPTVPPIPVNRRLYGRRVLSFALAWAAWSLTAWPGIPAMNPDIGMAELVTWAGAIMAVAAAAGAVTALIGWGLYPEYPRHAPRALLRQTLVGAGVAAAAAAAVAGVGGGGVFGVVFWAIICAYVGFILAFVGFPMTEDGAPLSARHLVKSVVMGLGQHDSAGGPGLSLPDGASSPSPSGR
jgi:hypothetical protein